MKRKMESDCLRHQRRTTKPHGSSYKCHHHYRVPLLMAMLIIVIELLLLTNVSHCAKSYILHWNTTNPLFRIDNNDHVIDVNKGNLQFEYDRVHIICPFYEPGTNENETEKYIIYNVSKVEYETCRITNADPRIIAICDKPYTITLVTISFRPFTPQPGGLEFKPGNDYYFISTSSRDDLHRRIGGRCSTNNTKVIFKVFGNNEAQKTTTEAPQPPPPSIEHGRQPPRIEYNNAWKNHHNDEASASDSTNSDSSDVYRPNESSNRNNYNNNNSFGGYQSTQRPTYVNSNNHNVNNNINSNNMSGNNINKPTKKTNEYDSRQNEVVKNEELTYNNRTSRLQSSHILLTALSCLLIMLMRNGRIT